MMMADQDNTTHREYRKGNWTTQETMILIKAKKMDEERRMKRTSGSVDNEGRSSSAAGGARFPTELRWKWVEDYCWSNGCLRSQNQCNDKWDNLMRDYKKVREYESRLAERGDGDIGSYWKLERHERKDRNLPTNVLPQIYEALVEVVERKGMQKFISSGGSPSTMSTCVLERPITTVLPASLPPLQQQKHHSSDPTPPPPLALPPPPPPPLFHSFPTLDSGTSEYPDSSAKRRKTGDQDIDMDIPSTSKDQVGSAISRSASIITEALQTCERQEERRHKEYISVLDRRLRIEESKTETDKEAIGGLVHAINSLASSIFALASDKTPKSSK
ncbi:Homeodomain-like superfamily protein [Thalictrum thalictroides]|uniref:Homeodomain-like superfamily protein n=1 Tax=Thalictrum thalictroides TaxID=46969 RepID=A0A7J6W266_THATH|nr:Homeodomain-like superfamily protein [Thalictrum thalictroides]